MRRRRVRERTCVRSGGRTAEWPARSDVQKMTRRPQTWTAHTPGPCSTQLCTDRLHIKAKKVALAAYSHRPWLTLRAHAMGRGGQRGAALTPFPLPNSFSTLQHPPPSELPTHPSTHHACSAGAAQREGCGEARRVAKTGCYTATATATAMADLREAGGAGGSKCGVGGVGCVGGAGSKHLQFESWLVSERDASARAWVW